MNAREPAAEALRWAAICAPEDILPDTGVCALVADRQVALFRLGESQDVYALDNGDPNSGANVLSRGLVGNLGERIVVASPIYKQHFDLKTGECLETPEASVRSYPVRIAGGRVEVAVPHPVRSTCPYCGVGCGVLATPGSAGAAHGLKVKGDPDHPANAGRLCVKGAALAETIGLNERLLHPRIGGQRVDWDTALAAVAGKFRAVIDEHGPEAVALYVSGQLLTEDYYVANKLVKGYIGTANIDTNSRLCMSSAVAGHQRAFGEDLVPCCYEDLELADLVVLVGSNAAWCHPVLYQRLVRAKAQRPQMKVVVVDPRATATNDIADLHLPLRPGSDVLLFNGLLVYLHQRGHADSAFIARHTRDASRALAVAENTAGDVRWVARQCGLDAARLDAFYELFAAHARAVTLFSQGVNQSSSGADKVNAIINCHLFTGRIGKPGMGPFSATGQPNAMGGREVGGLASVLAAHMKLEDAADRERVQRFWRSPRIAQKAGLKAVDLFEAIHAGRVKAVWIMATNPVVSLPDADRVREALQRCELVVVSDVTADTETARLAHVLLPAQAWGERDGTVTNSERTISRVRRFLKEPGEARPDWWAVCEVARRMGYAEAFAFDSARQIFDEHARLSAFENAGARAFDLSGLVGLDDAGYDALQPVSWPVRQAGQGTGRLFADGRFFHADGRARFVATVPRPPAHATSAEFPLALNTGRVRDQWHTMTRTGLSARLAAHVEEPFVDLHAHDAQRYGITPGALARVSSRWGSMTGRARCSGEVARGQVFAPMHWSRPFASDGRVGAVVNPAVDPVSGEPEFKHTPVRVEAVALDWHGVLLSRKPLALEFPWWVRVQGRQFLRYEIGGFGEAAQLASLLRHLAGAASGAEWIEAGDAGSCRAALIVDGRLELCAAAGARELPARAWLAGLFAKDQLGDTDRLDLKAGAPSVRTADAGPQVCSCFGVGRNTICTAIAARGLDSVESLGKALKCGTNCGSCIPELRALLVAGAPAQAERVA